jgi:hypothetical protein
MTHTVKVVIVKLNVRKRGGGRVYSNQTFVRGRYTLDGFVTIGGGGRVAIGFMLENDFRRRADTFRIAMDNELRAL